MRRKLLVRLDGALLVGGYSSPVGSLNATTAVDHHGTPFIPASALKGALREAVTRLHGGCTLVEPCKEAPCLACRLFGRAGTGTEQMLEGAVAEPAETGKLRVGDARPTDKVVEGRLQRALRVRHNVAIDRWQRSAAPQLLVQREVVDAPGVELVAEIEGEHIEESEWRDLERALALLDGIGGSRTRGLGCVEVTLGGDATSPRQAHVFPSEAPKEGMALVHIEALEPLVLGGLPPASNFVESLDFIPGSALRGALGNAAVKLRQDAAFKRAFVDPESRLLFSDALPGRNDKGPLPFLVPIARSSWRCKHWERDDHEIVRKLPNGKTIRVRPSPVDGLIGAALLHALVAEYGGAVDPRRCDLHCCEEPLERAEGLWPMVKPPITRIVTRLGRDIATGSAMPQMLYSVEQIEVGTRFVGTVAGLTRESLDLLKRVASDELRVGRGRSRGQGRIHLRIVEDKNELGTAAVTTRTKSFDSEVKPFLSRLRAPSGKPAGGLVAVLARTDIACAPETADRTIAAKIFGDADAAKTVAAFQATTFRSGWDEGRAPGSRAGYRPAKPVVRAGSAWLFAYEPGLTLDFGRIANAEVGGVGELRELGMGRIVVNHSLFKITAQWSR